MSLVHDKAANNKPLMSTIMGNKRYFASHSLFLQIERHIHQDNSLNVQRCVLNQIGSGQVSQEIINQLKKMDLKSIDCLGKTKIVLRIFLCLLPLALLPIGFDVGTDTALLVKYANTTKAQKSDRITGGRILLEFTKG